MFAFVVSQLPSSTSAPDLIHSSIKRIASLQKLFNTANALGYPQLSYRLPGANEPVTLVQLDEQPMYWSEGAVNGFVVAPFNFPEGPARWLRRDLSFNGFQFNPAEARTGTLNTSQLIRLSALYAAFDQEDTDQWIRKLSLPVPEIERHDYLVQVQAVLEAIKRGPLEKVVLSRVKHVPIAENTHPTQLFERMSAAYPDAFVSLVSIPDMGIWLGASPELLLHADGEDFRTMSLAGTRTAHGVVKDWTDKEMREQGMVTAYISEQLQAAQLEVSVGALQTVQAGQVQHLCNQISATGAAGCFALVTRLHPTPAVCGFPAAAARSYIQFHESHQRRLYSGFLGPVDEEGVTELYVNLRAMELHPGSASLYLGGGIVAGSLPEEEWMETEHKAETLLRILQP